MSRTSRSALAAVGAIQPDMGTVQGVKILDQHDPDTDPPIRHAFAVERCENGWEFVDLKYRGMYIVEVQKSQPDIKAVTIGHFKIAAQKYWNEQ